MAQKRPRKALRLVILATFLLPDGQGSLNNGEWKSGRVVSDILMGLAGWTVTWGPTFGLCSSSHKAGARQPLWTHHRAFPVNFAAMVHTHVRWLCYERIAVKTTVTEFVTYLTAWGCQLTIRENNAIVIRWVIWFPVMGACCITRLALFCAGISGPPYPAPVHPLLADSWQKTV